MEVVFLDELVWDLGDVNFDVFIPRHGGSVVKVLDVERTEPRIWCRDGAVNQNFCCDETCALCCCGSWEIEAVATGAVANTMDFRLVWAQSCFLFHVCDFSPVGDVMFVDKENGVGTLNALRKGAIFADSLGETPKVVRHAAQPDFAVGAG